MGEHEHVDVDAPERDGADLFDVDGAAKTGAETFEDQEPKQDQHEHDQKDQEQKTQMKEKEVDHAVRQWTDAMRVLRLAMMDLVKVMAIYDGKQQQQAQAQANGNGIRLQQSLFASLSQKDGGVLQHAWKEMLEEYKGRHKYRG